VVIHDPAQLKSRFRLAQDGTQDGIREELPDLVQDRGGGLRLKLGGKLREFPRPEVPDYGVGRLADHLLPEPGIGEESRDDGQGSVWHVEQREQRVAEDVLQTRSPRIPVELLKTSRGSPRPRADAACGRDRPAD